VTPPRQPFLHDRCVLVSAPTMAICARDGQFDGAGVDGLFRADRRLLSVLHVTVDGHPPEAVHDELIGAAGARFVGMLRDRPTPTPDVTLTIERRRRLDDLDGGSLTETIRLANAGRDAVEAELIVEVGTDFADVFSVKDGAPAPVPVGVDTVAAGDTGSGRLRMTSTAVPDWSVDLSAEPAPPAVDAADRFGVRTSRLRWPLVVPAGGDATVRLRVTAAVPPAASVVLPGPRNTVGRGVRVRSADGRFGPLVRQSLADLDRLQLTDPLEPADTFAAAGAPWYLTLFGRDSLWAAWFALPLGVELAASTLRVLARRQATVADPSIAAEPGKILHELRPPTLAGDQGFRLPPVYYGSIDSTLLWIRLLHRAWRWGMPTDQVRELLPALTAAVDWMTRQGEVGDGLLEYVDATGHGLTNQGWKDSSDSVQTADGRLASGPIVLCEVQGYAHAAAHDAAALLDAFDLTGSRPLRDWADRLAAAFHRHFWVSDSRGRYLAIAVDADRRPLDAVSSNPGHILTSGLLGPDQVAEVAARLVAPELTGGFGLRTMSDRSAGFNAFGYHTGSVWTHDTAIVAAELAAVGLGPEAWTLVDGILAAAPGFDFRMPELYAGESAADVVAPAPYPASCRPQAWAAGAAVHLLAAVLGIEPDVPAGRLTLRPSGLAEGRLDGLHVTGLRIAGGTLSVRVDAGVVQVLESPPGLQVDVVG